MNVWANTEIEAVAGDELALVAYYKGDQTITNPTVKVWKGTTSDVTSTLIPSGSASVVGRTVVLPIIVIPDSPASQYVVAVSADLDGYNAVRKIQINCQKSGDYL